MRYPHRDDLHPAERDSCPALACGCVDMTSAAGTAAVVRSIARYEGLPASGRWQRARPYGWKLVSGGSGLLYSRLPNVSEHRLVRDLADVEHAAEAAVVVLQAVRPRGPIKRT